MYNSCIADPGRKYAEVTMFENKTAAGTESKFEFVYNEIKAAVVNGEFPVGTVMSERKLSERYNVSRSPVREALKRFAREGLMAVTTTGRVVIPDVTLDEVTEVYELLEFLEPLAVRRCTERADETLGDTFEKIFSHAQAAIDARDFSAYVWSDFNFHSTIIYRAGLKRVHTTFTSVCAQRIRIMTTLCGSDFGRLAISHGQHAALGRAIIAGDTGRAEELARVHIHSVRDYYFKLLSRDAHM